MPIRPGEKDPGATVPPAGKISQEPTPGAQHAGEYGPPRLGRRPIGGGRATPRHVTNGSLIGRSKEPGHVGWATT
ncbi:hypothetical protein chiPu_0004879 [Chiloscyllium punctatum]|uniref:Uncharacterized protein n=1 Tax=Chiloscyllium punctatum TaxID=137246 RepID=A0A401S7T9_CHIPU|nr:hypothetical protein [Chiloscyllium punctatum]